MDKSTGEEKLRSLESKDRLMRMFEVLILLIIIIFNIISLAQINKLATDNKNNINAHRYQLEKATLASQEQLKTAAIVNRARLDVINCIISINSNVRTPEYIKNCYDRAESQHNIKIERFGDGL